MNRKLKTLTAAITLTAICAGTIIVPVSASGMSNSKGNFILENGEEMALYASDIDYLLADMNNLYAELPALPDASFPGTRKNSIISKGIIDYANGTVVIDSSDLTYLADEIDRLESAYKINTANALNSIGTYFSEDGSVTYNPDDASDFTDGSAAMLSFDKLYGGILTSQSVEHLSGQQAVSTEGEALYYASEAAKNESSLVLPTTVDNGFPLLIQAATAENISSGAAAWANGELIIGNGADNTAFYNQGYVDGFNKVMDGVSIEYQYHEHTGEQSGAGTGCWQGYHEHTSDCYEYSNQVNIIYADRLDEKHEYWDESEPIAYRFECSTCGWVGSGFIHDWDELNDKKWHNCLCACSNAYNKWRPVCGKTEGVTIESATIVFK